MDLKDIVQILDDEFYDESVPEDWSWLFDRLFIKKSEVLFREPLKNSGLVITNSPEVRKIYTAFSPSRYVLEEIRMRGIVNTLLVVKNPFDWDGRKSSKGFIQFDERDYQLMEGMGISIYSVHAAMDINRNDSVVSSAYAFAKVMKIKVLEEFAPLSNRSDRFRGVIGKVGENRIDKFVKRISTALDYRVKLQKAHPTVGRVAIITRDGFVPELVREAHEKGATTYITGVITPNASEESRRNFSSTLRAIRALGLNVIGCSRYLTEKWTMELSLAYFGQICKAEFIEDKEARKVLE